MVRNGMRSTSKINSAALKIHKLDDFHTEAMMYQSLYVVVGKETRHRGGHDTMILVM